MGATTDLTTWTEADSYLPDSQRCVLATDGESHFIACYQEGEWINAWTEEPLDSVILWWMELPPIPDLFF